MLPEFIAAGLGLALGGGAAFFLLRAMTATHRQQLEELREETRGYEKQLASAHDELSTLKETRVRLESRLASLQEQHERDLEHTRALADEKLKNANELREKLKTELDDLSAVLIDKNSERFLSLAKSHLEKYQEGARSDLDARQKKIGELVDPLKQTLAEFDKQVRAIEAKRAHEQGSLTAQIKQMMEAQKHLQQETGRLVNALRKPQVRGSWGELQLRRVVEIAGMTEYVDFDQQVTHAGENGRGQRPDMVIRMPNERTIVVDSKVPIEAFERAIAAESDEERARLLADHARQVREHCRKLGQKNYWQAQALKGSPDFVVLFMPLESLYSAALQEDPKLIEDGFKDKVIMATPTTLLALLRAVAYGWHQQGLTEEAEKVKEIGADLYKRFGTFADHFAKLGAQLKRSSETYNSAVGSLERMVLPQAEKLRALSPSAKELPAVEPVDTTPRSLNLPG